jgi:GNAT superfamily N-acetyltransferase
MVASRQLTPKSTAHRLRAGYLVASIIRLRHDSAMTNSGQPLQPDEDLVYIRPATVGDVDALAALSDQLGYSATPEQIAARLRQLLIRDGDHAVFVATVEGVSAGWVHVARRQLLETDDRAEILGLVVASHMRQRGIGRALIAAAESWAAHVGLFEVVVRSNVARAESHPFYERLGYTRTKTQHVYLKRMTCPVSRSSCVTNASRRR